ncbi:MAG: glycosyltransferase family 39 protein [Anaerolineae bacterium]|nr:glycosyltransferase family 39 protein [Anaerolineae bacterium]
MSLSKRERTVTKVQASTRNYRLGLVAAAWLALLAGVWFWMYSGVPLPRWVGVVRLVRELALTAFMIGAAYGWGQLALRPWHTPPGERPEPLWAIGLGFGVLWLATFAVAALHLLGPAWPWLLLGGGWLALSTTPRPLPRSRIPDVSTWSAGEWFLVAVMALSLGYSLLAWALLPPLAWDEVSYHLPIPQIYIEAGGFVSIPTIVHSNWPAGMEMLDTLALLMGSEILPHLTVTSMVVLTAAGLARFAQQRFSRRTAWLAAAIYLAMPMVKYLSGVALIEGGLGFFGFLAIWSGYIWLETRSPRDLILAGLIGGLAASIKLTGAALPIAVGSMGFAWLLLRRPLRLRRSVAHVTVYGGLVLIVVAPWYIKSVVYTGNPVWPFLYGILGGQNWDTLGDQIHTTWLHRPNLPFTPWNYLGGLWQSIVHPDEFGGLSMGAATLVLAPISLLFWRRKAWLLSYLAAASTVVYTAWFFTTHQTRFLMGIVPVLALLASHALDQLLVIWPLWLGGMARVALVLYLAAGLPFLDTDQQVRIAEGWPYVSGHVERREFLSGRVMGYRAFAWANDHLPPDAKVLLAVWETRGYYLERASIWANPISQRVIKWEQFHDTETLAQFLGSLGVSHVFWNKPLEIADIPYEEHRNRLLEEMLAKYGQPLYSRDGFEVHELRLTY